jgi:copper transport protein
VLVIIAFGTAGRARISKGATSSIGRLIKWESALVVVVLAVTSFLVASPPNAASSQSTTFSATLVQGGIVADLLVTPTKVGPSEVHVILTPPGGSLSPVVSATVRFSLPARDIPPIPATLIAISPNHWSGVVQFPFAGNWQMEARVEPQPNQTLLFKSEVVVTD